MMLKIVRAITSTVAVMLVAHSPVLANENAANANVKPHPLPQTLEIELALSALPDDLRAGSAVYTLDPEKGFQLARHGSNGFHAFVARTGDDALRGDWPLKSYRDDILYPVAFDEVGAAAQMRIMFDVAEMQAKGVPAGELKGIFRERVKQGHYPVPHRAGVSYMLSPILRTYAEPDSSDRIVTVSFPHVMYYAPNVQNHQIGGGHVGEHKVRVNLPGPHGYINQPIGRSERAKLQEQYKDMLAELCRLKQAWCLSP